MDEERKSDIGAAEQPNDSEKNASDNETAPADGVDGQSTGKRRHIWRQEVSRTVRTKAFLFPFLLGVILSAVIAFLPVESFFMDRDPSDSVPTGEIVYDLSSYLGYRHTVKFRLYVAIEDPDEKRLVKKKLPALKTALANAGDLPQFEEAIREENLNVLERLILTIVHDVTELPMERLKIGRIQLN